MQSHPHTPGGLSVWWRAETPRSCLCVPASVNWMPCWARGGMCWFTAAIDPRSLLNLPAHIPAHTHTHTHIIPLQCKGNKGRKKWTKKAKSEQRNVSTLDGAFGAIKPKPLNQFPLIWTGPSQSRKCQPVSSSGETQLLWLHTEHKLEIWFNKMPLFLLCWGRCRISSFILLFSNSISPSFSLSRSLVLCPHFSVRGSAANHSAHYQEQGVPD